MANIPENQVLQVGCDRLARDFIGFPPIMTYKTPSPCTPAQLEEVAQMRKFALAAVAVLLAPAVATADWIYTSIPLSPLYTVKLNGVAVVTGGWNTFFYTGSSPYGEPPSGLPSSAPDGWFRKAVTYCTSPKDLNSTPDAYNVGGTATLGQHFTPYKVAHALAYLLDLVEPTAAGAILKHRAAVQASIWKVLYDWAGSGAAVGTFNNTDVSNMYNTYYVAAKNFGVANGGSPYMGSNQWTEGLGQQGYNQDMIWTLGGPNGGVEAVVPLPTTAYGALAVVVLCLAGRRLLFAV
jgi:hypothetical protein